MLAISDSVAAVLLPRSTIVDPSSSKKAVSMPVMLANLANVVAASSPVMLVAIPSPAMTLVNSSMPSF